MIDFVIKMITTQGQPQFVLETDPMAITDDAVLETAVIISLFTDRLADDDDHIPDGTTNRRGWFGDALSSISSDLIGSRLWLLHREKQTETVRKAAEDYTYEALEWLLDDDVALSLNVVASYPRDEWLQLHISIELQDRKPLVINYSWSLFNGV